MGDSKSLTSWIITFIVVALVLVVTSLLYLPNTHPITRLGLSFVATKICEKKNEPDSINVSKDNGTYKVLQVCEKTNVTDTVMKDTYKVPNVVHYLWFSNVTGLKGKHGFNFVNYVSVKSVYKIQKPDKIIFHCDIIPRDPWWLKAWRDFSIIVLHQQTRSDIFNVTAKRIEHISDIIRLEILLEQGGIYLDCDIIIVKSLDPLRHYPATMGQETNKQGDHFLNAGTIIAEPNSTFLRLWYEQYKMNFRPNEWVYNSGKIPYLLYQNHSDLTHVEETAFSSPPGKRLQHMVHGYVDYSDLYTFHLTWYDKNYNEYNIKRPHTTAAEILRWIYYGTKAPVK